MDRFVVSHNIAHFRHLLETVSDHEQRRVISALLDAEIMKLPPQERRSVVPPDLEKERFTDV